MAWYTLNNIATMTGLTTRTLRNYLQMGLLIGEKVDGVWRFSEEQLYAFMDNPTVRQGMHAKQNAIVTDFLLMGGRKENRTCVILDYCMDWDDAKRAIDFFCEKINEQGDDELRFGMERHKKNVRLIISGSETAVKEIMKRYYEEN
jgi:hypothetical protein